MVELLEYYEAGETVTVEVQTANNGAYEAREVEVTLQEEAQMYMRKIPLPMRQKTAGRRLSPTENLMRFLISATETTTVFSK